MGIIEKYFYGVNVRNRKEEMKRLRVMYLFVFLGYELRNFFTGMLVLYMGYFFRCILGFDLRLVF